jgi:drug/metabolite transporter (DMT)-like permease
VNSIKPVVPATSEQTPAADVTVPNASSAFWAGIVAGGIVLLGAVLFSTKAIMVKLAMPYGIGPVPLLMLRMAFAVPFYVGILAWVAKWGHRPAGLGKHWLSVVFLGFIGYYLASYFDFVGLVYIPASLERVILYSYPTLVLLVSLVFLKKKVTLHQWIAIALCYVGVFVAVRFGRSDAAIEHFWLGVVLIFLSALTYAIYLVGSGELIPKLGVWVFTSYAMIVSSICVAIHFSLTAKFDQLARYPWPVYVYALAMAIFSTVIPSLLISEGIKRIGASNAAIIGGVGPISTIVLASVFLGESFTLPQMIGTALVIGGVVYISVNMKRKP